MINSKSFIHIFHIFYMLYTWSSRTFFIRFYRNIVCEESYQFLSFEIIKCRYLVLNLFCFFGNNVWVGIKSRRWWSRTQIVLWKISKKCSQTWVYDLAYTGRLGYIRRNKKKDLFILTPAIVKKGLSRILTGNIWFISFIHQRRLLLFLSFLWNHIHAASLAYEQRAEALLDESDGWSFPSRPMMIGWQWWSSSSQQW